MARQESAFLYVELPHTPQTHQDLGHVTEA